ncbi:MAG: hypothetical protein ACI4M5_03555 [Christensenellales bacterium]
MTKYLRLPQHFANAFANAKCTQRNDIRIEIPTLALLALNDNTAWSTLHCNANIGQFLRLGIVGSLRFANAKCIGRNDIGVEIPTLALLALNDNTAWSTLYCNDIILEFATAFHRNEIMPKSRYVSIEI